MSRKEKRNDEVKERTISFLSKKFQLYFVVFIISVIFRWFEKIPAKETLIIWILVPTLYAFWNVVNKLINQVTVKDIKDVVNRKNRFSFTRDDYYRSEEELL